MAATPSGFYPLGQSKLHYTIMGSGHRILFAFHGYGESAVSFSFLEEALTPDFTLIAIDMPNHGLTEWKEGFSFAPRELLAMMVDIAAGLSEHSGPESGWWLLGYSMGGRVALQIVELAPEKVKWLLLLAPDGLRMNPWYWLATQTELGNALFRVTMRHPGWFFFFLQFAHLARMVNPSVYKFTRHYIDDTEARQLLYSRWTVMSDFTPDLSRVSAIIRDRRTTVHLLYGRYDRIILWKRGEQFRQLCTPFCQLTVLPAGHRLLQPKFMEVILSALYLPII